MSTAVTLVLLYVLKDYKDICSSVSVDGLTSIQSDVHYISSWLFNCQKSCPMMNYLMMNYRMMSYWRKTLRHSDVLPSGLIYPM